MIRIRSLVFAAGLALTGASLAHADSGVTGKWTYKVGVTGTPCTLTLTATHGSSAGDVASGEKCPSGLSSVGHWRTMGTGLQLISPSGSLVAVLHPKGDGYVGRQIGGGRKIALSR